MKCIIRQAKKGLEAQYNSAYLEFIEPCGSQKFGREWAR
jgi:hypothetical protein